jgi:hypothetical protein
MSVINIAKNHFEDLGIQSLEIPEWKDDNGKPTIIYWKPINLYEKNIVFKKSENLSDVGVLADLVILKALDKDNNKIFSGEDRLPLMYKVDSDIISRLANAMLKVITPDEVKKN